MAKTGRQLSVTQLEQLLTAHKARLAGLVKRRAKLQATLAGVEKEIAALSGAAPDKKVRRKIGKRPKNVKPLKVVMTEVLGKNKKGLSLGDLAEKILATGYKSKSRKFSNVVYQTIYANKQFIHDDKTGTYRLK
jgi:hypothetical protein